MIYLRSVSLKIKFSKLLSLKRRFEMQFSTWNTIKLQAKMVSQLNFTIIFGELNKGV